MAVIGGMRTAHCFFATRAPYFEASSAAGRRARASTPSAYARERWSKELPRRSYSARPAVEGSRADTTKIAPRRHPVSERGTYTGGVACPLCTDPKTTQEPLLADLERANPITTRSAARRSLPTRSHSREGTAALTGLVIPPAAPRTRNHVHLVSLDTSADADGGERSSKVVPGLAST